MHRGGVVLGRTMQLTQERLHREQRQQSSSPSSYPRDEPREVVSMADLTSEEDRQLLLTLEALRHAIKRDRALDGNTPSHAGNAVEGSAQPPQQQHSAKGGRGKSSPSLQDKVDAFYRSLCTYCSEEERRLVVYRFLLANNFVIARTVEACRKTAAFRRKQNLDRMALFPSLLPLRGYDAQELCTALQLPYIANTLPLDSLAMSVPVTATTTAATTATTTTATARTSTETTATAAAAAPAMAATMSHAAKATMPLPHNAHDEADAFYGIDYATLYNNNSDEKTTKKAAATTTTTTAAVHDAQAALAASSSTGSRDKDKHTTGKGHNHNSNDNHADAKARAASADVNVTPANTTAAVAVTTTSSETPLRRWLQRAASLFATHDSDSSTAAAAAAQTSAEHVSHTRRHVDPAASSQPSSSSSPHATSLPAHTDGDDSRSHSMLLRAHDDKDSSTEKSASVRQVLAHSQPRRARAHIHSTSAVAPSLSASTTAVGNGGTDNGRDTDNDDSLLQYSEATASERLVLRLDSSSAGDAVAAPPPPPLPSFVSSTSSSFACSHNNNNKDNDNNDNVDDDDDGTCSPRTTTTTTTAVVPCALNFHALLQPIIAAVLHYMPMSVHYWDKQGRPVLYCKLSTLRSRQLMQRLFELTPVGSEPVALAVLFQAYVLEVLQQLIRWNTHKHARLRRIADVLSVNGTSCASAAARRGCRREASHASSAAAAVHELDDDDDDMDDSDDDKSDDVRRSVPLTTSQRGVASCVVVLDAAGMRYHRVFYRPMLRVVRSVVSFAQRHYPELLHHLYLVNCDKVVRVAYVLIRGVLGSTTRRKLTFCDRANTPRTLLDVIDAELLPVEYGGRCVCRDGGGGGHGDGGVGGVGVSGCIPPVYGTAVASVYGGGGGAASNSGTSVYSSSGVGGSGSRRATLTTRNNNNNTQQQQPCDDTVSMTSAGDYSYSGGRVNDDLTSESLRLARAYGGVGSEVRSVGGSSASSMACGDDSYSGSSHHHHHHHHQHQQHSMAAALPAAMLERYVRKCAIAPRKSEVMAFSMRAGEEVIWEFAVRQQRKVVFSAVFVPASGEGGVVTLVTKQRVCEDANHFVSPAPGTVILKWSNKVLIGHRTHVHIKVYHDGELDDDQVSS